MDLLMPFVLSVSEDRGKAEREERGAIMECSAEFLGVQLQEMYGQHDLF